MPLTFTFLGTSSMVPTKERNVQAAVLEREGELFLFDCGEGTQRQMNIAGFSRSKIRRVLLSHWHGDHVGGLISLIQTIFNSDYQHTLHIHGPKGTKKRIEHLRKTVDFENPVEIEVHEHNLAPGEIATVMDATDYYIEATPMQHGTPCIAYAFLEKPKRRVHVGAAEKLGLKSGPVMGRLQRGEDVTFKGKAIKAEDVTFLKPGKKVVVIPDTTMHNGIPVFAEHADLLVCESTYATQHEDKATQNKHLTSAQAALMAQQAQAERLILTHFSQRYLRVDKLVDEAKTHFPNVEAAHDFMKVKV